MTTTTTTATKLKAIKTKLKPNLTSLNGVDNKVDNKVDTLVDRIELNDAQTGNNTVNLVDNLVDTLVDKTNLNEIKGIIKLLNSNNEIIKDIKREDRELANKVIPLVFELIEELKTKDNAFSSLSRKKALAKLKSLIGNSNAVLKDCITFLGHNNLRVNNEINITNMRAINSLIKQGLTIKSLLDKSMSNDTINEVIKKVRLEEKEREKKEYKILLEKAKKYDALSK